MIINKLKLHNFKSYADVEIEFNTGLSIIIGANGAGKSSILEAISFALYKEHLSPTINDLVRTEQERMKVELEFQNNGKTYNVIREKTKSSNQSILKEKENNKYIPIVKGDKAVNFEIKNLINMDKDLFLNAVYVRQGEIANLINKNQSEKKRLISKLLGIDSLEKAWENIRYIINDYEKEKENYKGKIESLGNLNEELDSELKRKKEHQKNIDEYKQKIGIVKQELIELEKEKTKLDETKSKNEKINNDIETNKQLLLIEKKNYKNTKNKLNEIYDANEKIELIKPKIKELEKFKEIDILFKKIETLKTPKEMYEKNIKEINEYKTVKNNNLIYYEEYIEIQKKLNIINEKLGEFSKLKEKQKTYDSNKSELQKNIKKLEEEIKKLFHTGNIILKKDYDDSNKFEEAINIFIDNDEIKVNELINELKNIENKNTELKTENKNLTKSINELSSVAGKCPVCNSDITEIKKNELLKQYYLKLDDNNKQIQKNVSECVLIEQKIHNIKNELKNIKSINIELLKDKIKNLDESNKKFNETENKLNELLPKIYSLNESESEKTSKNERLDEIQNNYENFITAKTHLENKNIEEVNIKLQNITKQINQFQFNINSIFNELGTEYSLKEVTDKISSYSNMNNEYNQLLGKVHDQKIHEENIEKSKNNIEEIEKKCKYLNNILLSIDYNSKKHESIKTLIYDKNSYLNKIIGNKQKNEGILSVIEEKINKIKNNLETYSEYKTKLDEINEYLKLLKNIREIYSKDGAQKVLRNESRPIIEYYTNELFKEFNFNYSNIELNENYDIIVYGPSGKTALDMMSGGEKIAIALALRLGITNTLSENLEMIMLDEPTIHLDNYRRHELIDILKNLNLLPQMIIVTHDNDLEEAANNIFKIEKNNGISTVKQE